MPWSRKLECPDCTNVWTVLLMRRTDRNPPCPVCQGKGVPQLAAPNVNRGAVQDTRLKIPEGKTKQIDFAQRIISEDNGGANMKDKIQIGETANIPIPIKPEDAPRWGGGGASMDYGTAMSMAKQDPTGGHGGLLGKLADKKVGHMAPVYRPAKPA